MLETGPRSPGETLAGGLRTQRADTECCDLGVDEPAIDQAAVPGRRGVGRRECELQDVGDRARGEQLLDERRAIREVGLADPGRQHGLAVRELLGLVGLLLPDRHDLEVEKVHLRDEIGVDGPHGGNLGGQAGDLLLRRGQVGVDAAERMVRRRDVRREARLQGPKLRYFGLLVGDLLQQRLLLGLGVREVVTADLRWRGDPDDQRDDEEEDEQAPRDARPRPERCPEECYRSPAPAPAGGAPGGRPTMRRAVFRVDAGHVTIVSHQRGVGIFERVRSVHARRTGRAMAGCRPAGDVAVRSGHSPGDDPAPRWYSAGASTAAGRA